MSLTMLRPGQINSPGGRSGLHRAVSGAQKIRFVKAMKLFTLTVGGDVESTGTIENDGCGTDDSPSVSQDVSAKKAGRPLRQRDAKQFTADTAQTFRVQLDGTGTTG